MRYIILFLLLYFVAWSIYQRIKRKLRIIRGEPEPEYKTPRNVKLLAVAVVAVYGLWIVVRLFSN